MGLDAFVYCNCFKEGKTTEPPLDKSLIVIDEDGFYNLNITRHTGTFLIEAKTGEELYCYIASYGGKFFWGGRERISFGFDEQGFFIIDDNDKKEVFRSMHFSIQQKDDIKNSQESVYEFYDFDKNIKVDVNNTITTVNMPAELRVVNRKLKVEDIGFTLESLYKVFKASIETGNPVVWI